MKVRLFFSQCFKIVFENNMLGNSYFALDLEFSIDSPTELIVTKNFLSNCTNSEYQSVCNGFT